MKDTKETSHLSSAKLGTKMGEKPLRNHKDSTFRLLFSEPERAIELYNFYIGTEKWESQKLYLSDSFLVKPKENSLELVVNLINLNYNKGKEILKKSPSLLGYSKLLHYIAEEKLRNGGDLKKAIDAAVKRCIDEGLIADFLQKHSREITGMLFKEITVEEFAEIRAREAYEDGEKDGAAHEKRKIAKEMLREHIEKSTIAKITGLLPEEIEKL